MVARELASVLGSVVLGSAVLGLAVVRELAAVRESEEGILEAALPRPRPRRSNRQEEQEHRRRLRPNATRPVPCEGTGLVAIELRQRAQRYKLNAYTLNEEPQPQVDFTWGFSNLNPAASSVST